MRFKTMASVAALALGACMVFAVPASAQVARGAPAIAATDDGLLQNVQYRRYYGGPYRPYPYRPYYRERRSDTGAAVAAGIIGLAAGAIIAGAASAPPPPPMRDARCGLGRLLLLEIPLVRSRERDLSRLRRTAPLLSVTRL
jgi:hypothetical protein